MPSLQTNKNTTLSGALAAGATSGTLSSAVFSDFTGGYLVIDYDNASLLEVIKVTVTGTALSAITRGVDDTSDVDHAAGAKVGFMFVPSYYDALKPHIDTGISTGGQTANSTTFVSGAVSKSFTTTGGRVIAIASFSARTGTAGDFMGFRIKRASTVLKTKTNIGGGGTNNERYDAETFAIETPAAGTYTYDVEFNRVAGGGTITVESIDLLLIEVPV